MNEYKTFVSALKIPIIITLLLLALGSIAYLTLTKSEMEAPATIPPSLFDSMQLKAAYAEDDVLKVFATTKNNELVKLSAAEGTSLPEADTIIIGYEEAAMMKEEKLFSQPGDRIENIYGITTMVRGILDETNTAIDMIHITPLRENDFN